MFVFLFVDGQHLASIGPVVSEKKMYENVDGRHNLSETEQRSMKD